MRTVLKNIKYFVVSDVHSHYQELIRGLKQKGYDAHNKEHVLIVLGDLFDRGQEPLQVFNFIKSIPASNRILIRGNHEDIFLRLAQSDFPDETDFHNGTVGTFCKIANTDETLLKCDFWDFESKKDSSIQPFEKAHAYWQEVKDKVKKSELYAFINSKEWHNYYEIGDYIFCHGYIPLLHNSYNPAWRYEESEEEWQKSRWRYAHRYVLGGYFDAEIKKHKTIVFGHIASQVVRLESSKDFQDDLFSDDIYYGEHFIAIDACTYESKKVNILVLKSDEKGNIVVEK